MLSFLYRHLIRYIKIIERKKFSANWYFSLKFLRPQRKLMYDTSNWFSSSCFYTSILRIAGWKAGTWPLLQPLLQSRWKWSVWIFSLMTTEASPGRILRQQMFRIQIFYWSLRLGYWFKPDSDSERQKWQKNFMFWRAYVLSGGLEASPVALEFVIKTWEKMPIIQFLINKYEIFVHFATFFNFGTFWPYPDSPKTGIRILIRWIWIRNTAGRSPSCINNLYDTYC